MTDIFLYISFPDYPNLRLKGHEMMSFWGKQIHFVTYPHILYENAEGKNSPQRSAHFDTLSFYDYRGGKMQLLTSSQDTSCYCEVLRTT